MKHRSVINWGLYRIERNTFCIGYDPVAKVVQMSGPVLRYNQRMGTLYSKHTMTKLVGKGEPDERVKAFAERVNPNGSWVTHRLGDFTISEDFDDDIPF